MLEEIVDSEGNIVSTKKKNLVGLDDLADLKQKYTPYYHSLKQKYTPYYHSLKQKYTPYYHSLKKTIKNTIFTLMASSVVLAPLAIVGERHFRNMAKDEMPWAVEDYQSKGNIPLNPLRSILPNLSYKPYPCTDNCEEVHSWSEDVNSWGYHDDEFIVPKPDNLFRVAVVGDSMTYGAAVKKSETFSNKLERMMDSQSINGKKIDVVNLGVPGYQASQCYATIKYIAIPLLQPDLIIYAYYPNDLSDITINYWKYASEYPAFCFDNEQRYRDYSVFIGRDKTDSTVIGLEPRIKFLLKSNSFLYNELEYRYELFKYNSLFPKINNAKKSINNKWLKQIFGDMLFLTPNLYPHVPDCIEPEFSYVTMEAMERITTSNNIKFVIGYIPYLERITDNPNMASEDEFIKFFRTKHPNQNVCLNAYSVIEHNVRKRNLKMKDICASSLDSHPNAYGHELIAEGFYDYLMDHRKLLKKKYIH